MSQSHGEGIKYNCLHRYNPAHKFTIAIDWLQFAVRLKLGKLMVLGTDFEYGTFRWIYTGHGTQHYKWLYHLYRGNEHMFTLQISPKKSKDETITIVKLENHLLYGKWHNEVYHFNHYCVDQMIRISRLDIAIDGLNYLRPLLKETRIDIDDNRQYKMIGKSTLSAYKFNRLTGMPNGYKLGSPKGNKQVVVYNKSKELEKGNKPYIKDFWKRNGLSIKDGDVDRFEARMLSGFLSRLTFDSDQTLTPMQIIENLRSDAFKLGIVTLFTNNFFEFVYKNSKNTTHCKRIDVLPKKTSEMYLSKLKKRDTVYKSKLTIHNMYKQVCDEKMNVEDAIVVMKNLLQQHDMYEWYEKVIVKYDKDYEGNETYKSYMHGLAGIKPAEIAEKRYTEYVRHGELLATFNRRYNREKNRFVVVHDARANGARVLFSFRKRRVRKADAKQPLTMLVEGLPCPIPPVTAPNNPTTYVQQQITF
ncbi:MAG: hypothetical protein EOP56_13640 [Sphingobacteriales bacterium]|nr:MAG: hypothetical protein EOP56_13640 [Sphingobacteriales bacterium]